MSGYSGTPLAKKLGIQPGCVLFVDGAPMPYGELVELKPDDVRIQSAMDRSTDIAHLFVVSRSKLAVALQQCLKRLRPDAAIWISWPKKASKVPTDVTEDVIRELALPLGLVDIKVCAVDEVWSGLKLVVRKELRPSTRKLTKD